MSKINPTVVAKRYLEAAGKKDGPNSDLLLDLAVFLIGWEAMHRLVDGAEELAPGAESHYEQAGIMLRRFQPSLAEQMEHVLGPLMEESVLRRYKALFQRATRPSPGKRQALIQAEVLKEVFSALRSRGQMMRQTFQGRALKGAMQLGGATTEEDPRARLNKVASIVPVTGKQILRKWNVKAAKLADAGLTDMENLVADSGAARILGEKLRDIEAKLASLDPTSQEAADLVAEQQSLQTQVEALADASSDRQVILSAAMSTAASGDSVLLTKTAKEVNLTPEQEDAMRVKGKSIIAAGAGSGKTRVLAAKVVYTIKELGAAPNQIIATSFSRKSAHELFERIKKYGGEGILDDKAAEDGFGTTHSVAGGIISKFGSSTAGYQKIIQGGDQSTLIKMAMAQVQMRPDTRQAPEDPDPQETWFPDVGSVDTPVDSSPGEGAEKSIQDTFDTAVRAALDAYQWQEDKYGPARWRTYTMNLLNDMIGRDPSDLTDKQKDAVNKALGHPTGGRKGRPFTLRSLERAGVGGFKLASTQPVEKTAARSNWNTPANMWFNLGQELKDAKGRAMGSRRFGTAISKYKANLMTPGQAWAKDRNMFAAVFGAYEWLKKNDPKYVGRRDHDDTLIQASAVLIANPQALGAVQSRFKYIFVDEAQDLNKCQHLLFGLIAGYYDPETQEPNIDGSMKADTYTFIGDDKQCVDVNAPVDTPSGTCRAGDLKVGDQVLSNRNGKIVPQTVKHVVPSHWTEGFKITTESGKSLLMSPNHRLWATEPRTTEGQVLVYLMYRKDMGFRVGITNKGKVGSEGEYLNSFGDRAFLEKAEKLWVLDICEDREQALLEEARISLRYGIPTAVFNGEHRGLNPDRIEALFKEFGKNGMRLLEERHLHPEHPHWMSQSYTKHGRERHVVNLIAHSGSDTQVSMEWSGGKFDGLLDGMGVREASQNRRRLRRWFANYREGLAFAEKVSRLTGAQVSHRLSTPEGPVREITASGLFEGMQVVVREGDAITLDAITTIEKVAGEFVDLDVDDASNFFAGGILTHNSIYEFRGADPDVFIGMSDLVPEGAGFQTMLLDTNFRSGKSIVDAANKLMEHNTKQIPMTCNANVERKGMGEIQARPVESHQAGAEYAAEQIETLTEGEAAEFNFDDFGIACRTNAEAYAFGVEMLKRGIPFRSKMNFFNDYTTKAIIAWLRLANANAGDRKAINQAVLECYKAPRFWLDARFEKALQRKARGENYLEWLENGGWRTIYDQDWRNRRNVLPYTDALRRIFDLGNSGASPEEMVNEILALSGSEFKGKKTTFVESLIENLKKDGDAMDILAEESPDGKISDEAIREAALSPIQPLLGILGNYGDLGPAMDYVGQLQNANQKKGKKDDPSASDYDQPAVVIDTVHGWKGLECKRLFVNMPSGVFPHVKSTTEEDLASERRLAYVALTRGENRVDVLAPEVNHLGKPAGPSRFIDEACIPTPLDEMEDEDDEPVSVKTASSWTEADLDAFLAEDWDHFGPQDRLASEWWGE